MSRAEQDPEEVFEPSPPSPEIDNFLNIKIMVAGITGPIITRYQKWFGEHFPGLHLRQDTQTRFVLEVNESMGTVGFLPWNFKRHGEWDELLILDVQPAQLQRHLHDMGIVDFQPNMLTPLQVINARKKGGGVRIHPSRRSD